MRHKQSIPNAVGRQAETQESLRDGLPQGHIAELDTNGLASLESSQRIGVLRRDSAHPVLRTLRSREENARIRITERDVRKRRR